LPPTRQKWAISRMGGGHGHKTSDMTDAGKIVKKQKRPPKTGNRGKKPQLKRHKETQKKRVQIRVWKKLLKKTSEEGEKAGRAGRSCWDSKTKKTKFQQRKRSAGRAKRGQGRFKSTVTKNHGHGCRRRRRAILAGSDPSTGKLEKKKTASDRGGD